VNDPDRRYPSDGLDDDAIFADIVAHLNDDVAEDERTARLPEPAPASDDATYEATHEPSDQVRLEGPQQADAQGRDDVTHDARDDAEAIDEGLFQPMAGDQPTVPAPQVWRSHEVDDEDEEHFEPLPLAPLPVGDLQFWAIIAGMVGGPLMLVYLVFFNRDAGSYWMFTAIAMSVAGFALLISRLPGHDEDDDGARL